MANHVLDQYRGTLSQKLLQHYRARARPTRACGANYSPRSLHTEPRNFTYMCAVSPETAKRTYGLLPFLSNDTDPMRPYETSGCCMMLLVAQKAQYKSLTNVQTFPQTSCGTHLSRRPGAAGVGCWCRWWSSTSRDATREVHNQPSTG